MTQPDLHPRHPGCGSPTSLIKAEGRTVEEGGFFIFLPSGLTKGVAWRAVRPITPTIDAAKKYAAQVLEELLKSGHDSDAAATNWVSVTAAIQRIIGEFNEGLTSAIRCKVDDEVEAQERRRREEVARDGQDSTVFTFPAYHETPAPAPAPPPDPPFPSGGGGDYGGGGSSGDY